MVCGIMEQCFGTNYTCMFTALIYSIVHVCYYYSKHNHPYKPGALTKHMRFLLHTVHMILHKCSKIQDVLPVSEMQQTVLSWLFSVDCMNIAYLTISSLCLAQFLVLKLK